ncbi:Trehalose utilization [Gemmata obscuriglobus]|uniref:ThuA domain-containing protein n=2 Tax=Gemmata TaxID=113 RepID=A0A2Z3H234_9BACT|nr:MULTISPECIES: ThuA domain-containing protein [Gemmata]AWM38911.1 ThuA domain-containing protein [Gemmata obscuriglobus]MDY3555368.1 ThuA domain-containing protein [Gemmata algarum]MDY3560090.1 ThuA domain-containing protein [Gemmata algarum]QEG28087.1 Trehalose utilization [Gemmata obscuriglobus]VTS05706.1 Putative secreted glycosyl hydrolase OS=Streptomyces scabies (strain 87.22) GN=SCAB_16711 PE=4 SV=1: ThuA [Gemmata obscuriglobus UQM 2246]
MRRIAFLLAVVALCGAGSVAQSADKNKRLLLVTHSGGFIHGSVGTAEEVLKAIGPASGFDVTCWRFTGDPDAQDKSGKTALQVYSDRFRGATKLPVEKENCGRINKETLKNFDVVLFFTTGNPLTKAELTDLREWVKAGGALCGTHCATDTQYTDTVYGDLIGGYFKGHPSGLQKIKVKVEDPKHPAAAGFTNGMDYQDEMYIFKDAPYSRERLHIIFSVSDWTNTKLPGNLVRKDGDYAIAWCREEEKGKVFYTSFGHDPKVWKDEKFQSHLFGGLRWATGQAKGDATPSGAKK